MSGVVIAPGDRPGDLARVVELHGRYYARDWGLPRYFEAKVAAELGALVADLDPTRDGFWVARKGEEVVGGIAIDGRGNPALGARLRFFILGDGLRGGGIGKRLFEAALDHCRKAGFRRVWLTTFAGLDAARSLYERAGFRLIAEAPDRTWGKELVEQTFALDL